MAKCRIYLFTYNRNNLLPRAIGSLLDQTMEDWVCEVHNDNPDDAFPGEYIAAIKDNRFTMINHATNLGAVAGFNLAFAGCPEPYASILEDDNWWEPAFLSKMTILMDDHPEFRIAWSNMKLWEEKQDGDWADTGRTTWPIEPGYNLFSWPLPQQAMSALHSTGAMLYRGIMASGYIVPESTLQNAVELIRERAFEHPLCLINEPLANFAITLTTNRSENPYVWISTQLIMLASFISEADAPDDTFKNSLAFCRTLSPTPVSNFFLVNRLILKNNHYYGYFTAVDWFNIIKWLIRNGLHLGFIKTYMRSQAEVQLFLNNKTRQRYREQ